MGGRFTDSDRGAETAGGTNRRRHRLLESERRHSVLGVLADRSEPMDLDALATAVAHRERPGSDVDDGFETRVRISLYHVHVPKLVDAGVCSYRGDGRRVAVDQTAVARLLETA